MTRRESTPDIDTPLSDIRVLDLSRVFAGPLCGQVLADFGAQVIKVEHPVRGDDTRDWGMRIGKTETNYFNSMNRNKRSITVDLKHPEGRQLIYDLLPLCDVVLHNFKTGGAEGLGLGYEQLKAVRPDLVYCAIAGYDSSGPEASRPGYDLIIQGEAGLMNINGAADMPPLKFGVPVVDMMTGMGAAQAVMAALLRRNRTGQGQLIEMALYDTGLSVTSYYALEALALGTEPERYGNNHPSIMPYGLFDALDGPLNISVGNNAQFERFCRNVIERPDLADDPRFKTNVDRGRHRDVLAPLLTETIKRFPRSVLLERLHVAGIPCGEVAGIHAALTSERSTRSGLVQDMPHPDTDTGTTAVLAPPYRLDGTRLPVRNAPPTLGEGTHALLQQLLDLSDERLHQLQQKGVITLPEQTR